MDVRELIITLVCILVGNQVQAVNIDVSTSLGMITGKTRDVVFDGKRKQVVQFLGIPYAEPPIGDLRFAAPVSKSSFSKTFEAFEYGYACPQFVPRVYLGILKTPVATSEDCLCLNIFTPNVEKTSLYPVMVFIHGGGFILGESKTYSGHILASYGDVVVVTINYRLGPFGFLSTEDDQAPGNAGLWDQHLAIKWVKDHITSFGGDTSRITIFGESAGAGSVSAQMIYDGNKDLFQRTIVESGSVNAFWSTNSPGSYISNAKLLAQRFDCSMPNINIGKEILKCLRAVKNSTEIAINAEFINGWVPRVDEDFITSQALSSVNWSPEGQSKSQYQMYDVMIGTNGFEGHFFLSSMFRNVTEMMKVVQRDIAKSIFKEFVKKMIMPLVSNAAVRDDMLEGILFFYSDAEQPNDRNFFLKQVSDYITDLWFFVPSIKDISAHSYMNKKTKTYQYEFNHLTPISMPGNEWLKGATHGAELLYVFGFPSSLKDFLPFSDKQVIKELPTIKIIMDYWTNFAKTGNPNAPTTTPTKWKEYSHDNQDYLYFPMKGTPQAKQLLNAKRTAFWMEYVPKLMKSSDGCSRNSADSKIGGSFIMYLLTCLLLFI